MLCSFSLLSLIRLTALHSTTGAFLSLRSSDAEKKSPPCLGIFCLIRQKPPCQLRVATAPVLRSFLQLFWTKGSLNSCNPSGMKTVTSSDWIPAVAGIQLYREVFEVSASIVNHVAVSKTSRYNPFALRRSSITRSDRAKRISYFQFLLSYLTLSLLFFLWSIISCLSTANWILLLPTAYPYF